jgi:hypothetical protein
MIIRNAFRPVALFHDNLVYICFGNSLKYPHFGILCQEISGNPDVVYLMCTKRCIRSAPISAKSSSTAELKPEKELTGRSDDVTIDAAEVVELEAAG